MTVTLMASLPDEIDRIAEFVRAESGRADLVIVTGGLGGTPTTSHARRSRPPSRRRRTRSSSSPSDFGPASRPTPSTRLAGPTSRPALARSRTRSAARRASWSRTSSSCRASRRRCRRCSRPSRTSSDRAADHLLEARLRDDRGEDRRRPRGDGRPLPGRARRLVPEVPRRGRYGRGRRQVVRPGRARSRRRLDRAGPGRSNGPDRASKGPRPERNGVKRTPTIPAPSGADELRAEPGTRRLPISSIEPNE